MKVLDIISKVKKLNDSQMNQIKGGSDTTADANADIIIIDDTIL
ncbi:MAG: hypothetical protein AAF990_26240 [Bacteroidota bacterium]